MTITYSSILNPPLLSASDKPDMSRPIVSQICRSRCRITKCPQSSAISHAPNPSNTRSWRTVYESRVDLQSVGRYNRLTGPLLPSVGVAARRRQTFMAQPWRQRCPLLSAGHPLQVMGALRHHTYRGTIPDLRK